MRIAVVGGGIAGLALAVALRRRAQVGEIVVFEQDSGVNLAVRQGHGMMLMENGVDALQALGVSHIIEGCTPLTRAVFREGHGVPIRTEALSSVYCTTRATLVEGLRGQLGPDVIRFERRCREVTLSENGLRVEAVQFADGASLVSDEFDLFVGAEGWRSPFCDALNPGFVRPTSPVLEIVTSTHLPDFARQLGGWFVKTMFPERGVAFGLLASTREQVIGFLQFDSRRHAPPDQGASPDEVRAFLQRLLVDAPEPIPEFLRQVEMRTAHLWLAVNSPAPERFCCDNAVVIGDAAHPMLPFTSQGASAALEDAAILAERIHRSRGDAAALATHLRGFSALRRRAVEGYIRRGQQILSSFLDPNAAFAIPYVDGAVSELEESLALPNGSLRALFRMLDHDGDGRIDRREFRSLSGLLGDEVDLVRLFEEIDRDNSGTIEVDELILSLATPEVRASPSVRKVRLSLSLHRLESFTRETRLRRMLELLSREAGGSLEQADFSAALASEGIIASSGEVAALFGDDDDRSPESLASRADRAGRADISEPDPLFADTKVDRSVLSARAYNFRWADQPPGIIPLTSADLDFPVCEAITAALRDYLEPGYLSYGPAEGLPWFRETAAHHLNARFGIPSTAGQLMATNSAASGLYLAVKLVMDAPGCEAIIPDPVDFLLERSVVAAGGRVRRFPIQEDSGWSFDPADIETLVSPRTRLLSICNPHNPLGRVWRQEELEAMAEIALRHDLWILSDEVWSDIVYEPSRMTSTAALSPEVAARTLTITGFSKNYGMAGLRLGVLAAPDEAKLKALVALSHADETAYGVSTLSQVAGAAAYRSAGTWLERLVSHLKRQRDYAVDRLNAMHGVRCHSPEGTFVLFPDVSGHGLPSETLVERLQRDHRVALVPGAPRFFGPGAAGHLRISFATSRAVLAEGLDRLEAGLESQSRE